jgi:hypothetical protein
MPDITTPISPLDSGSSDSTARSHPTLLTIPLEIRLQIYHYVLLTHSIHHAHIAPLVQPTGFEGMNTEEFHTTMLRPNGMSIPFTSQPTTLYHSSSSSESIVVKSRREREKFQGKVPTALLISCRQVFEETHMLPWENNTFTFINWFWSGIYAARQFTRGLREWQSDGMRWVGVEVLGRDLWVNGNGGKYGEGKDGRIRGVEEWMELCGLWSGVWGLRLGIKGDVIVEKRRIAIESGGHLEGQAMTLFQDNKDESDKGILNVKLDWVEGLKKMRSLRWVEMEIEDEYTSRETKLSFCQELEKHLNISNANHHVRIIFIEKIKAEEKVVSNKDFVWYGGEPGDDSVWGLDT